MSLLSSEERREERTSLLGRSRRRNSVDDKFVAGGVKPRLSEPLLTAERFEESEQERKKSARKSLPPGCAPVIAPRVERTLSNSSADSETLRILSTSPDGSEVGTASTGSVILKGRYSEVENYAEALLFYAARRDAANVVEILLSSAVSEKIIPEKTIRLLQEFLFHEDQIKHRIDFYGETMKNYTTALLCIFNATQGHHFTSEIDTIINLNSHIYINRISMQDAFKVAQDVIQNNNQPREETELYDQPKEKAEFIKQNVPNNLYDLIRKAIGDQPLSFELPRELDNDTRARLQPRYQTEEAANKLELLKLLPEQTESGEFMLSEESSPHDRATFQTNIEAAHIQSTLSTKNLLCKLEKFTDYRDSFTVNMAEDAETQQEHRRSPAIHQQAIPALNKANNDQRINILRQTVPADTQNRHGENVLQTAIRYGSVKVAHRIIALAEQQPGLLKFNNDQVTESKTHFLLTQQDHSGQTAFDKKDRKGNTLFHQLGSALLQHDDENTLNSSEALLVVSREYVLTKNPEDVFANPLQQVNNDDETVRNIVAKATENAYSDYEQAREMAEKVNRHLSKVLKYIETRLKRRLYVASNRRHDAENKKHQLIIDFKADLKEKIKDGKPQEILGMLEIWLKDDNNLEVLQRSSGILPKIIGNTGSFNKLQALADNLEKLARLQRDLDVKSRPRFGPPKLLKTAESYQQSSAQQFKQEAEMLATWTNEGIKYVKETKYFKQVESKIERGCKLVIQYLVRKADAAGDFVSDALVKKRDLVKQKFRELSNELVNKVANVDASRLNQCFATMWEDINPTLNERRNGIDGLREPHSHRLARMGLAGLAA